MTWMLSQTRTSILRCSLVLAKMLNLMLVLHQVLGLLQFILVRGGALLFVFA